MRIVIAAGGTGGHIYPGIALAETLKGEILFIGSREGLEGQIVKQEGYDIKLISARALLRKISWKAISAPFVTLFGLFQAIKILQEFKPKIVISTGGYVSFPVIAAAKLLKIPVLLHEQNALPGMTNRFWSRFVDIVTLSFQESTKYIAGTVTGNPVRERILNIKRQKEKIPVILILGGSQGARSINQAVVEQLPKLIGYEIIHIIGERDYDQVLHKLNLKDLPSYHPKAYMYNIEEALSRADLVVSRAGATAISEMLVLGLPSILIPFPYSAEGHQDLNAEVVRRAGAGIVLKDNELNKMANRIIELLNESEQLNKMSQAAKKLSRPDAAEKIGGLINAAG